MDIANLPENTEDLLVYLLVTAERSGRTYETLRRMKNVEPALAWLMENGYVYEYWGSLDLTLAGLQAAREIQNSPQETQHNVRDTTQIMPNSNVMIMLDTHPLRPRRERSRLALENQVLHFLLAFDVPKNALPIPVLDGDILGRIDEADINLPNDNFLSGQHCRFNIKLTEGRPTLYVTDLESRNGTYVNKVRLTKGQSGRLEHGSRVAVGNTLLLVVQIPR